MSRRLLIGYLAITLLVLSVLIIPLGVSNQRRQLQEVTAGLERDAFVLASFAEADLASGGLSPAVEAQVRDYVGKVGSRVVVVDETGEAVLDTAPPEPGERNFASRPEVATALAGQVSTGTRRSETLGTDLVYAAVPVASGGVVSGAVRVTYPTAEVDSRARRYWLALGGVALVSLAVVAIAGVAIARSVTRPLRDIEDAARDVGAGDLGRRVPEEQGPREVRSLARAFNRTTARLQDLVGTQDAFVADASHQLRTPLTALRLRLENLEASGGDAAAGDLEDAVEEVDRLARLVDGLLVLARADQVDAATTARRLDVGGLMAERVEVWRPFAEERGVDLSLDVPVGTTVRADPDRLAQVLDNYVANALDVAPAGTVVGLAARPDDGRTCLHVVDHGPGLTDEQRSRAFDRFWRAGTARSDLGGSGLGLAIVAKLVQADGGTARLEPAEGGGIDAVVELPA